MRIEKITYGLSVNKVTGENWEKIDAVITVGEDESDDDAFKKVEEKVHQWKNRNAVTVNPEYAHLLKEPLPPNIQVEKPIRDTVDNIIEDINSCKEVKVLESYKLIAKTNERIMNAYNEKLKSFQ